MECPQEVGFAKARASAGLHACVEVCHDHHGEARVRNSRFPTRVVVVPRDRWQGLVVRSQAEGRVDLAEWFPEESYGDFAGSFYAHEAVAFESGILGNEPRLVGAPSQPDCTLTGYQPS